MAGNMVLCEDVNKEMVQEYLAAKIPSRPVKALVTMLACFSVLGFLGNSLVLYVYVRKRNKLSSTVFIIALAGIDLVTSAVGMPYTIVFETLNYQLSVDFFCKLYYFVITCTVPFSVFIMVAIAIDRYICICRPHSHVLDSTRARNFVLILLVIAVVIGLMPAMFYGVYLDVESLHKDNRHPGVLIKAARDSLGNMTNNSIFPREDYCASCASEAVGEPEFTDKLMNLIVDLYRSACVYERPTNQSYIYTGHCLVNKILFPENFMRTYQTIYSSSFLVCFSVVFVLYIMIYRSVLVRRSRRLASRSKTKSALSHDLSVTENQTMLNDSPDKSIALEDLANGVKDKRHGTFPLNKTTDNTQSHNQHLLQQHIQQHNSKQGDDLQHPQKPDQPGNPAVRDKYFLANIRTAIMLFVVSVTFVIAYLPSWLMAFRVIRFNVIIFYVYFSNHIVNPIIYAFMNPAFRRALKGLVCRKKTRGL